MVGITTGENHLSTSVYGADRPSASKFGQQKTAKPNVLAVCICLLIAEDTVAAAMRQPRRLQCNTACYSYLRLHIYLGGYDLAKVLSSWAISQIAKRLCDRINNYPRSNAGEEKIPDHVIKSLARLFLPDILEFYSAKDSTEPEQQKKGARHQNLTP